MIEAVSYGWERVNPLVHAFTMGYIHASVYNYIIGSLLYSWKRNDYYYLNDLYTVTYYSIASSPGLPRLFVAASDVKAGRPGRFWYVMITSDRRERHFLTTKRQVQAAHTFEPMPLHMQRSRCIKRTLLSHSLRLHC